MLGTKAHHPFCTQRNSKAANSRTPREVTDCNGPGKPGGLLCPRQKHQIKHRASVGLVCVVKCEGMGNKCI